MMEAQSSSWQDLLPELLGLILTRLSSLVDRVRLRAVCHSWRSNAQLQLLPLPLPWLTLLDGTFLTVPDGKIIRMLESDDARCFGSFDDWLFVHHDGRCSLMNPFSKATRDLPKLGIKWFNASSSCNSYFTKLAVPSPMESAPGSLVAALILDGGGRIRIFQQSIGTYLAIERNLGRFNFNHLSDIAFFNGRLYGVDLHCELSIFEINSLDSESTISSVKCITRPTKRLPLPQPLTNVKVCMQMSYLVECCGKLLMVIRLVEWHNASHGPILGDRTVAFEVFEADWSTKPGQWRCVSKLGGQALFVGKHCSKSFPAGGCTGIQEDCIHFMCDYYPARLAVDPLRDSGVYNMRNGIITPLLSETAITPQHSGGQGRPTWIFPRYAM